MGRSPRARRIIASSRLDDSPHVSPDGKHIAFESSRSGAREIWVTDADGGHPRQLTFLHGRAEKPQWSPDGRSIAFDAFTSGRVRPDIYVIAAAGGSPRALTADASFDTMPTWAADGASLYFLSDRGAAWEIWNVPIAGGPARRVTEGGALRAQESADGSSLFYGTDTPEVKRRMPLAQRRRGAGRARRIDCAIPGGHALGRRLDHHRARTVFPQPASARRTRDRVPAVPVRPPGST